MGFLSNRAAKKEINEYVQLDRLKKEYAEGWDGYGARSHPAYIVCDEGLQSLQQYLSERLSHDYDVDEVLNKPPRDLKIMRVQPSMVDFDYVATNDELFMDALRQDAKRLGYVDNVPKGELTNEILAEYIMKNVYNDEYDLNYWTQNKADNPYYQDIMYGSFQVNLIKAFRGETSDEIYAASRAYAKHMTKNTRYLNYDENGEAHREMLDNASVSYYKSLLRLHSELDDPDIVTKAAIDKVGYDMLEDSLYFPTDPMIADDMSTLMDNLSRGLYVPAYHSVKPGAQPQLHNADLIDKAINGDGFDMVHDAESNHDLTNDFSVDLDPLTAAEQALKDYEMHPIDFRGFDGDDFVNLAESQPQTPVVSLQVDNSNDTPKLPEREITADDFKPKPKPRSKQNDGPDL